MPRMGRLLLLCLHLCHRPGSRSVHSCRAVVFLSPGLQRLFLSFGFRDRRRVWIHRGGADRNPLVGRRRRRLRNRCRGWLELRSRCRLCYGDHSRCGNTIFSLSSRCLVGLFCLRGPGRTTGIHRWLWGHWRRILIFKGGLKEITRLCPEAEVVLLGPRLKTQLLITFVEEV